MNRLTSLILLLIGSLFFLAACNDEIKSETPIKTSEEKDTVTETVKPITDKEVVIVLNDTLVFTGDGYVLKRKFIKNINSEVYYAIIDLNKLQGKILGISNERTSGQSSEGIVTNGGAKVALSGGFVDSFFPVDPSGLLKIDNKIYSKLDPSGYSSILAIKNNKFHFLYKKNFIDSGYPYAFQIGPQFIRQGKNDITSKELKLSPATRSFIIEREDGKLLIGITKSPIHLYDLANYLLTPGNEISSIKCLNGINLSGGGSESIACAGNNKVFAFGNSDIKQASMLVFFPK